MRRYRTKLFERVHPSYWLLVLPILHQTVPWVHLRVRTIIPFILTMLWALAINRQSRFRIQNCAFFDHTFVVAFISSFFCYFLQCLYFLIGHGAITPYYLMAMLLSNIAFLYVLYVSLRTGRFKELKFLTLVTLIGLIWAGISSARGLAAGIEGSRAVMSARLVYDSGADITDAIEALNIGLGNYGDMYVYAAMSGALLFAMIKIKDMRMKILSAVALFGACLSIRGSGLGTPVFVLAYSLIMCIGVLMLRRRRTVVVFAVVGVLSLTIFIATPTAFSFMAPPFRAIAESMDKDANRAGSIKTRILSVAEALEGNQDTYAVSRFRLHRDSFDVFCDNFLIGCGSYNAGHPKIAKIGGHSYFLDKIAREGLPGLAVYIMLLFSIYKSYKVCSQVGIGREWLPMPMIYLWSFFFASIANPVPVLAGYCFILFPGLALFFRGSIYDESIQRGTVVLLPNYPIERKF